MFRNFLTVAVRIFWGNKVFSIVNISGLALGFSLSIFIVLFVSDEWSYDRFHDHADRVYRIGARGIFGNTLINQTYTCAPLPGVLLSDYPEVEQAVRIQNMSNVEVRHDEVVYNEDKFFAADSGFFDLFSFPLISGDPDLPLRKLNGILLSETSARKYFGDNDPLGEVLRVNNQTDFEVTGVFRDIPRQSHFHFNFIVNLGVYHPEENQGWMSNRYITYILLREGADPKTLESKFPELIRTHIWPGEGEWEKLRAGGNNWEYFLQPLTGIHLTSDLNGEFEANGRMEYMYIFLYSAIFVLVIAAINFTNLTTARAGKRAKEVGLRKALGSGRRRLIQQFLLESVFTALAAWLLANLIVLIAFNAFGRLSGKEFLLSSLAKPELIGSGFLIAVLAGILAGVVPSLRLSALQSSSVMKSGSISAQGNSFFKGILVIVQFFISILLIIGTLVIYRQLEFFQKSNLGFKNEKVLVVHGTDKLGERFGVFRDQLLQHSQISHVSGTQWIPGGEFYNWGVTPEGWDGDKFTTLNMIICDTALLNTLEMEMTSGRFFSPAFPSDSAGMIINEEAAKIIGWDDPVGKKISIWGYYNFEVIGVIRDFHYESMHQLIRPMGMIRYPFSPGEFIYPSLAVVKIRGGDPRTTLRFIEDQWKSLAGGIPFSYTFMDSDYQAQYQNEIKTGNVFLVYSVLSLIIAAMGLFALSSFIIDQRTKEIGIRKVNGAGTRNIVFILTRDFTRWVLIAIILAIPAGSLTMNFWLNNFAYKADPGMMIFAVAALTGLLIAWLTVSIQTIRAAHQNPARLLRYE